MKLVMYLADLYEEITPLFVVIGEKPAFLRLLRDG